MDRDPTAGAAATGRASRSTARTTVWHDWVVPLGIEAARAALDDTSGLRLPVPGGPGTLTTDSRRWRGSWRWCSHEGPADVELTRLTATSTLVEVCLWPAPTARVGLVERRRRGRVAAAVADRLGVDLPPRRGVVEPVVVRLTGPRPAGRMPGVVLAVLIMLAFTPTVWALLAGQGPTPVTEERALAEHRARIQQLAGPGTLEPTPSDAVRGVDDTTPPDDHGDDEDAPRRAVPATSGTGGSDARAEATAPRAPDDEDTRAPDEAPPPDTPPDRPGAPETGVYQYATDGGEAVAAPGGARDYPERTSISVTEDGCGHVARWTVLDERWDERETCDDGGIASQTSYREFFGMAQQHEFTCDEQRPDGDLEPGRSWEISCEADEARMDGRIEVLGLEELDVGGTAVATVHLRLEGELSGGLSGSQRAERWLAPDLGGLLIREQSRTRASVESPMGEIDYREDYRLDLLDLRPRT